MMSDQGQIMRGEAALLGVILGEPVRPSPFDLAVTLTFIISTIHSPAEVSPQAMSPAFSPRALASLTRACKTHPAGGISRRSGGVVLP
jgi:hypothetical protein